MPLNRARARQLLSDFDFQSLFVEEMSWNSVPDGRAIPISDSGYMRRLIAEMSGVAVLEVFRNAPNGTLPDKGDSEKIHTQIAKLSHENVIIFLDDDRKRAKSLMYWVKREEGKRRPRRHHYFKGQPGDLFMSKIDGMVIEMDELREDGTLPISAVTSRLAAALDIERVTKRFYERFRDLRVEFIELIEGIEKQSDREWYASVLLNRLMFIYFLQKRGFIQGNSNYLDDKLEESRDRGPDRYYREFLDALFFEGFAKPAHERSAEAKDLLGPIPYLNGGLFIRHKLELDYGAIHIPDAAFENVLRLFGRYSWHLDDTPGARDNEINPDVLGYIFEKYINQKAFGAYYTRGEITEYLCERSIHSVILEKVNEHSARQFSDLSDVLMRLDAELCRTLLFTVLPKLSILDPACGSGAFLVAAMKNLLNIYGVVYGVIDVLNDRSLSDELEKIRTNHPSLNYYIRKRIIVDNLYGVDIMDEATEIAKLRLFLALTPFHWGYEFDEIMETRGGFDVIITNPPWEVVQTTEKEFFLQYDQLIKKNKLKITDWKKQRSKLMQNPEIQRAWLNYASQYPHQWSFFKLAPQFLNQTTRVKGKGSGNKPNMYSLFTEQCSNLLRHGGHCGVVLPSGIYTDSSTMQLRKMMFANTEVTGLFGFENRKAIFEGVHKSFKFVVLTFEKGGPTKRFAAAFMRRNVKDLENFPGSDDIEIDVAFVRQLSPDSLSIPEFKSEQDIAIAKKMLSIPLLANGKSGWGLELYGEELNMTRSSSYFKDHKTDFPVYEGGMIWHFDSYYSQPRYWIEESELRQTFLQKRRKRIPGLSEVPSGMRNDYEVYRLAIRKIASNTNERTLISSMLPRNALAGNSLTVNFPFCADLAEYNALNIRYTDSLVLITLLNSFVADYVLRARMTTNLNLFYLYQLPVPRLYEADPFFKSIVHRASQLICTTPEYDDLAAAIGLGIHHNGVTDPAGRAKLRAELDGIIAHIYGLTEDEFAYVLSTFPLVAEPVKAAALAAYRDVKRGVVT